MELSSDNVVYNHAVVEYRISLQIVFGRELEVDMSNLCAESYLFVVGELRCESKHC
jgi:hypothetical protein